MKKSTGRKLKEIPPYRKFNGKRFRFYSIEYFGGDVERIKAGLRKDNVKVRVLPNTYTREGWVLYVNKENVKHPSYYR